MEWNQVLHNSPREKSGRRDGVERILQITTDEKLPPIRLTPRLPEEFRGLRVTVMGLGQFGGGLGAIKFLVQRGAVVSVTDQKPAEHFREVIAGLAETPPACWRLGEHREDDFRKADLIVASPAVPREHPLLHVAQQVGIPITSEMNLFWQLQPGTVVGITGSNGKSTTTAMTHALLAASGRRCWLGGNIGRSLLPMVDQIQPGDLVVLELSSFMLEDLDCLQASPHVAVVTNFAANHLDRHQTLENYRRAKQVIMRWQTSSDIAVLNADDPDVWSWPGQGRRFGFSLRASSLEGCYWEGNQAVFREGGREVHFPLKSWLTLPGQHNVANALAASCAALAINSPLVAVEQGLRNYRALPHRLELIAEVRGRRFYNDSLATTPESTLVALDAFEEPLVVLVGGSDKGSDFGPLARALAEKPVKGVALMGTTGPRIGELIARHDPHGRVERKRCENFREAVVWADSLANPGDVVLLSPGCASYDWFRNFADRGNQFREFVEELRTIAGN